MKNVLTWLPAAILVASTATSASASPGSAWYGEDWDRMFWFVVVNDSHIGCGKSCTENLDWATGEAFEVIQPKFVFNCGDLVDATNGGWIPTAQYDQEWSAYRQILDENGMNTLNYVDLPGNHDAYFDKGLTHYLEWSIQGSLDQNTQHSVVYEDWFGKYHFLAVATPTMNGGSWFADNAALDAAEMQFIEGALMQNADADLHFAFGHHGVHWGTSNKVGEGGTKFESLMKSYQVSAYFWGHTHDYFSEFHAGTLFHNTRSLGKSGDWNFTLAAVDHDAVSVRTYTAGEWPYVLITAPVDSKQGESNPYAYPVAGAWDQAPVRAVVFSKDSPDSVAFRIDGGDWASMEQVATSTWQGVFDATQLSAGQHELRVRANPWSGADHQITFNVATVACSNGSDDDKDGLTDFPDDPGCANPADQDETDPPPPPEPEPEPLPDVPEPEPVPDLAEDAAVVDIGPADIDDAGTSPDETTAPTDSGNGEAAFDGAISEPDAANEIYHPEGSSGIPEPSVSEDDGKVGGGSCSQGGRPVSPGTLVLVALAMAALALLRRGYS